MVGDPPDFVQLRLGVDRPPRAVARHSIESYSMAAVLNTIIISCLVHLSGTTDIGILRVPKTGGIMLGEIIFPKMLPDSEESPS